MPSKDWTEKIKNSNKSPVSEFLKPFAGKEAVGKAVEDASAKKEKEPVQQMNDATDTTDFIDKLLDEKGKKKKDELVLTGIYLHPEIAQVLDKLGKKGGRGAKSRIVNDALRKLFLEKGLL